VPAPANTAAPAVTAPAIARSVASPLAGGAADSDLTAAQIVEKNTAARGGLEAWRKIDSMVWSGHIERGSSSSQNIPFVMELKRPNKTRFEIKAMSQSATRVYDGAHGWKQSPSAATGVPEVQPYTAEELKFARDAQGFDGPLLDSEAKGIAVSLAGTEQVEGRKAYRLNVRLPSGTTQHVWVDAETFLDVKYDRMTRNAAGMTGQVSVMYRDYRTFEGLQIPVTIETGVGSAKATDKMVIEKISLNPRLDDRMFAKPRAAGKGRHTISIGEGAPQASQLAPAPLR